MVRILGLKTCDTCRKARKALPDAAFTDVRDEPLSHDEISELFQIFGADLLNRKSTTWRGLSDEERVRDAVTLLTAHPTLMKRPVILDGDNAYLGWTKDVQDKML